MKNNFPRNLKFLRNRENMTQDELAKKMGKDYSTIGKWELGQRNPMMADILKLSDIFNISVQDIVEKDLRIKDEDTYDETNVLFDKYKDVLTDDDKETIRFIIEKRKREIDKELGK